MHDAPPPLLWRIVATDPPTAADFLSNQALGRQQRRNEPDELFTGISTFDSIAVAASVAQRFGLGTFLAGIVLEANGAVRWAQTRGEGHYTVWGAAADLLARVVNVQAVEAVAKGLEQ